MYAVVHLTSALLPSTDTVLGINLQPGLPGTAYGIAQICIGDVWRGQQWYDATMEIGGDGHSVVFTADLGADQHPWGQENAAVWQVRFAVGAFPSCALMNENGIPLAPFGPLAVSPACSFEAYRARLGLQST